MLSIEEICRELQKIDRTCTDISGRLERERGEIINSMNKAQSTFGGTQEGQGVVLRFSDALNKIVYADDSLYSLRSSIQQLINRIKK